MKFLNSVCLIVALSLGFIFQAHALDNPKYTPSEENSNKGTLAMEELYIGGVKSHQKVNIEFDFSNSTFVVIGATPADNSIPEQAIETQNAGGLSVGLRGCVSKNRSVTCYLLLTSNEFDRTIKMCGNGDFYCRDTATSFDNKGNQYFPNRVTISNSKGQDSLEKSLIADTVTEATIVFDNLSTLAINFSQIDLGFVVDSKRLRVKFNNVDF